MTAGQHPVADGLSPVDETALMGARTWPDDGVDVVNPSPITTSSDSLASAAAPLIGMLVLVVVVAWTLVVIVVVSAKWAAAILTRSSVHAATAVGR